MGSNPSRDATALASNCSQKFTKDLLDKFLSSRASGTSPKTIGIYHLALDRFVGYPLTPEGINAYLNLSLQGKPEDTKQGDVPNSEP